MELAIAEETDPGRRRQILEKLTARLPQWFGRPEANRHYAEQAERLEALVARIGKRAVGLLLLKRHSDVSAEIYWLGVEPEHHRRGIGRRLCEATEHRLRHDGTKFLFVATLHPSDPYEPYRRTHAFYESMGFELALSSLQGSSEPSSNPPSNPLAYYLKLL
ncbi:MAG: GNAT family N-acetyltransferase [Alphaproteobacteria bacterium]|nr:GNAT family N-acetyltransferase [Alphaproteobacteria bacterium]MBV8413014.1 GNAT family N-acetyltransferase [Alphaproteobacteria bacterium]